VSDLNHFKDLVCNIIHRPFEGGLHWGTSSGQIRYMRRILQPGLKPVIQNAWLGCQARQVHEGVYIERVEEVSVFVRTLCALVRGSPSFDDPIDHTSESLR
jgi:hypothetical protein